MEIPIKYRLTSSVTRTWEVEDDGPDIVAIMTPEVTKHTAIFMCPLTHDILPKYEWRTHDLCSIVCLIHGKIPKQHGHGEAYHGYESN